MNFSLFYFNYISKICANFYSMKSRDLTVSNTRCATAYRDSYPIVDGLPQ